MTTITEEVRSNAVNGFHQCFTNPIDNPCFSGKRGAAVGKQRRKKSFLGSLDINEVSSILNVTYCIKKALLGLHKLISLSHLKHTCCLLLVLSGLELDDAARQ